MKQADKLFLLIKSLTGTEKRYFKLFASMHMEKQSQVLQVFNAIDKQVQYSEENMAKQFKNTPIGKYLPEMKSRLYYAILKSMRSYHSEKTVEQSIRTQIDDIGFLYDKVLYNQCEELIKKLADKCIKYGLYTNLSKILQISISLQIRKGVNKKSFFKTMYNEQLLISKADTYNAFDHQYFYCNNFAFIEPQFHPSVIDSKEFKDYRKEVLKLLNSPPGSESFNGLFHYYKANATVFFHNKEYLSAIKFLEAILSLYNQHPHQKNEYFSGFCTTLFWLFNCYCEAKKFDSAEKILIEIEQNKRIEKNLDYQYAHIANRINFHFISGKWEESLVYLKKNEALIQKSNTQNVTVYTKRIIQLNAAWAYFGNGRYEKVKTHLAQIQFESNIVEYTNLNFEIDLLDMLIHFEKNDYEYAEHRCRSILNAIVKSQSVPEYLRHFVKKMLVLNSKPDKINKKAYADIKTVLERITPEKEKQVLDLYYPISNWLESKISGIPLIEVFKKKGQNRTLKKKDMLF